MSRAPGIVLTLAAVGCLTLSGAAYLQAARPQAAASKVAAAAPLFSMKPVLEKYCIGCHNERSKSRYGNLALDSLDLTDMAPHAEVGEKLVGKLRAGTMPPGGAARPDKATYDALVASFETALDTAAVAKPNPGRPVVHRLNRLEYVNTIRDLLALEIDGPAMLPADNSGFGFDNIGDVLTMSPALLARYMSAGRKISRLAVADSAIRPASQVYRVPTLLLQEDRRNDDMPFGTRGGLMVRHNFPLDGEYVIRIDLQKDYGDQWRGQHEVNRIDLRLDGSRLKRFELPKSARVLTIMAMDGESPNDGPLEYRFMAKAGSRSVAVALLKRTVVSEGVGPERLPVGRSS